MKELLRKLILFAVSMVFSVTASAYDFEVDGFYYDVVSLGDLTCQVVKGDKDYQGDIVIPSTVVYNSRQFTVTSIGTVFEGNKSITSIKLPKGLTYIELYALKGCSSLTSVVFPESLTEIGVGAFSGCSGLTSVILPESLTEIGESAFSRCSGLTSVVFPGSLTSIGSCAFYYCSGLTSVTFPESLSKIGSYAFEGCSGLTSLSFPKGLTFIGSEAFKKCESLNSIVFENNKGDVKISYDAFCLCKSLQQVILPTRSTMYIREEGQCFPSHIAFLKIGNLYVCDEGKISGNYYSFSISRGKINTLELGSPVEYSASYRQVSSMEVENLILSENYSGSEWSKIIPLDLSGMKTLVSKCLEPPVFPGEVPNKILMEATVEVPIESLEKYQQAPVWKDFWNLKGVEGLVGIEQTSIDVAKSEIGRYDLTGKAVSEDYRGIVIVRYSDGSTKKMVQR